MTSRDPDRLGDLGKRLDDLEMRRAAGTKRPPPTQTGIAGRLATDLVGGLVVGGGIGWGIDRVFGTTPWGLVFFFILGAFAAIYGVVRTAQKINAEIASAKDVEEK